MANTVGNMSPLLNNTNPMIDLRERFDEFYHIRTAEWRGFYPSDMAMTPDAITDEFRSLAEKVCPSRSEMDSHAASKINLIQVDVNIDGKTSF